MIHRGLTLSKYVWSITELAVSYYVFLPFLLPCRHPYIEVMGSMYLMNLLHGDKFCNRAGSTWRLLFVFALFPWLAKYRVLTRADMRDDDEMAAITLGADVDDSGGNAGSFKVLRSRYPEQRSAGSDPSGIENKRFSMSPEISYRSFIVQQDGSDSINRSKSSREVGIETSYDHGNDAGNANAETNTTSIASWGVQSFSERLFPVSSNNKEATRNNSNEEVQRLMQRIAELEVALSKENEKNSCELDKL
jgi:hypothetical protein